MNKFALILITSFTISTCHPVGELDITSIPSETFQDEILPYLKPKDISSVRLTSRNFKDQADEYLKHNIVDQKRLNDELWETLKKEDFLTTEYLTKIGADVNSYHQFYSSFESYTDKYGSCNSYTTDRKEKTIKFLLDHGKNFSFHTFCEVAKVASPEVVSQFLEVIGKNGNDIASYLNNEQDHQAFPIIYAAGEGNYPVVQLLLENGADPNVIGNTYFPSEKKFQKSPLEKALLCFEIAHDCLENYQTDELYQEDRETTYAEIWFNSHKRYNYYRYCNDLSKTLEKIARLKRTANLLYAVSNDEVRAKAEKHRRRYPNYFSSCSII
jgi:hypothetical protein